MRWSLVWMLALGASAQATSLDEVVRRLDIDVAAGHPLVAHIVVALADNEFQGIVPVPAKLGDGDAPRTNLYWGAMYGVRSFFRNQPGWTSLAIAASKDPRVLERVLFTREFTRQGKATRVVLVAEAWRGRNIADAIRHFLELNRGEHAEPLRSGELDFVAGGAAHVIAYVGHNGLMEFPAPSLPAVRFEAKPHASVALACMSDSYFTTLLDKDSVPLIMTTGLMAPEAYTLDALIGTWFAGGDGDQVRQAAARAYGQYQKTSVNAARRLFVTHAMARVP
jgi:hypothetical protein